MTEIKWITEVVEINLLNAVITIRSFATMIIPSLGVTTACAR